MFPINLNVFVFTQICLKPFSFAQIYLRLLYLTQMFLFHSDVSNFTQNVILGFLVGPNLMKAVRITT